MKNESVTTAETGIHFQLSRSTDGPLAGSPNNMH